MGRTRRHRKGEGSVVKIGPCKYMAKWYVAGKAYTKRITAATRDDAERQLSELTLPSRATTVEERNSILRAMIDGAEGRLESERYRLCDFPIDALEYKYFTSINTPHLSDSTKLNRHYNIKFFVDYCKSIGIVTVHNVTQDTISKFLHHLQSEKTEKTYNVVLRDIKKVWKSLSIAHKLDIKIFDGFILKKTIATVKRNLTDEETERLLEYLSKADIETKCFWFLGLYCGMRKSDCSVIKWDSIDFEKHTIRYIPIKTSLHGTVANVYIHDNLYNILTEIKELKLDDVFVLPTYARLDRSSVKSRIRKVFKSIGIETKDIDGKGTVGFHSLRHGFITKLLDNGTPITSIADMVGHRKTNALEMTLGYHNSNEKSQLPQQAISSIKFGKEIKEDNNSELERLRKENAELKERLAKIKELFNI